MRVLRKALSAAKKKLDALTARKHANYHLTAEGLAASGRNHFLLGRCVSHRGGPLYRDDEEYWADDSDTLDRLAQLSAAGRLGEAEFREVARTEPWRSVWSARKGAAGVFGRPASELSDEQRGLVSYSLLYDSVYEHPECPPDDVVEDDDRLDGWLIEQRRERESRAGKHEAERLSAGVKDKQEVFLVADCQADAERVMSLNDAVARAAQRERFAAIQKRGVVAEQDMPDTRRRLRMQAAGMAKP
jgi:hypothetical protein